MQQSATSTVACSGSALKVRRQHDCSEFSEAQAAAKQRCTAAANQLALVPCSVVLHFPTLSQMGPPHSCHTGHLNLRTWWHGASKWRFRMSLALCASWHPQHGAHRCSFRGAVAPMLCCC